MACSGLPFFFGALEGMILVLSLSERASGGKLQCASRTLSLICKGILSPLRLSVDEEALRCLQDGVP